MQRSLAPTCILMCLCMYIFVLFCFVLLCIPCSWLTDSLFLLDTGRFICPTTSCRTRHRTFSPIFHRFSECACFAWLRTEIVCLRHTHTGSHVFMSVCLLFWVYLTDVGLTLIHSRSSYNHTYQHAYLCVCACIYLFFFSFCFAEYTLQLVS